MSSDSSLVAKAAMILSLHRYPDGRALWGVSCSIPDTELFYRTGWTDLGVSDEAMTWANDFHGESKAWRSQMECVAWDWCTSKLEVTP